MVWQPQGTIREDLSQKVYDIDLYDTSELTISDLKRDEHIVICYFSPSASTGLLFENLMSHTFKIFSNPSSFFCNLLLALYDFRKHFNRFF